MRSLPFVALAVLATPAFSQSLVDLYPGATSFTSRGNIGTGAGETLQGFHKSHFAGLGNVGPNCAIRGFRYTMQDFDSTTQESFNIVVRAGSDANGPTTGTAATARLARLGPVNLPVVPAGGTHAWTITINLTNPVAIPCEDFFAIGAELGASPNFPTDGISTHASLGTLADQHANAIDNAWQIIGGATAASNPSGNRIWRYGMIFAGPSLQMGVNGKFGNGGMFPVVGGALAGRIDGATANGMASLWIDLGILPGFPLFPGTANVYLAGINPKNLATTTLDANGDGVLPLGNVPSINPTVKLYFQALITGGTSPQLTNAQATTFDQ